MPLPSARTPQAHRVTKGLTICKDVYTNVWKVKVSGWKGKKLGHGLQLGAACHALQRSKHFKFGFEFLICYESVFVKVGRQNILYLTISLIFNFKMFRPMVCLSLLVFLP